MTPLESALKAARDTKRLVLCRGAMKQTAEVFRDQFGEREAIIVADAQTMAVAGKAIGDVFASAEQRCQPAFVFTDPNLYAEMRFVDELTKSLSGHDAIPVAVGSGTINDVVKLAAHRTGRAYMSVATAASMDGYTAYGSSITFRGSKQTFDCPAPRAVVADVDVIRTAPPEMTASGYADLLAKVTAGADWIVADALGVEPIDAFAWQTVQGELREALADPAAARAGDPAAIERLTQGLMMGGFAMQAAQSSRPASGAEHQFSHLWDMQHHTHNGAAPSHGFKVGVATVAVARFYEKLLELPLDKLDIDAACAAWPDRAKMESSIAGLFAEPEVRDVALRESLVKYVTRDELRVQLLRLRDAWPNLIARLSKQLPPSKDLASMLRAVGAPTEPEQIGISRDRLRSSFQGAFHIRRRFTVLDLAVRANVLDGVLDRMFAAGSGE